MYRLWKKTFSICIEIGEKKICHRLPQSSTIADLRTILEDEKEISRTTRFINNEGCMITTASEKEITVGELSNENNGVHLKTDQTKSHPIELPKMTGKLFEAIATSNHNYLQSISIPGLTTVHSQNRITTANDLDSSMWKTVFKNSTLLRGIRMYTKSPEYAQRPILKFRELNGINSLPLFQVKDDSNISVHMTDNEIQSSFVSNRLFDVGLECSDFISDAQFKIKGTQTTSNTTINRTKHLTCCFNYPRTRIYFDRTYLEPTSDFIQSIDEILSIKNFNEQMIKLDELFSIYGHVYPYEVTLGAHLYHTEKHFIRNNVQEQEEINKAQKAFSTVLWLAKINIGVKNDSRSQKLSSDQNSSVCLRAVGGDTLTVRDPKIWSSTVADPNSWRAIKQDDCRWITSILDQNRKDRLVQVLKYYFRMKKFGHIYSNWKQHAINVAGRKSYSNESYYPEGISIDDNQTIYVADSVNHRIIKWESNENTCTIVAGGNGCGNGTDQLSYPKKVIIDQNNNYMIIADRENRRVMRWSLQNQTSNGQIIIENIDCTGLAMDKDGSIYVCDSIRNEVKRWKQGETNGTVVAGGNGRGNQLNQLNSPSFIFIDDEYSLYISDMNNHRVMKWLTNANEGFVVAGGNGQGDSLRQLCYPQGVTVDPLDRVYVADLFNHRVMRWCQKNRNSRIIVGGNGYGEESNQLFHPIDLSFDLKGNLYVTDKRNQRIQKFEVNFN